jgi:hypothetical protein
MSALVVKKESAVLGQCFFGPSPRLNSYADSFLEGLPREHVQYMQADHRQICKFSSPTDPNYLILQRCFLTTIEGLKLEGQWTPVVSNESC